MTLDMALGVQYLHAWKPPIIHRDLKSLNLLVTKDFKIKVRVSGGQGESAPPATSSVPSSLGISPLCHEFGTTQDQHVLRVTFHLRSACAMGGWVSGGEGAGPEQQPGAVRGARWQAEGCLPVCADQPTRHSSLVP